MVDPVSTNVPDRIQSFRERYGLIPQFGYSDPALAAVAQLDFNKAIRGGNLIPKAQFPAVYNAAATGQAQAQPKPDTGGGPIGWIERFGRDAAMFARSLPQIPGQLVKEAKALPQAPAAIEQAIASGHYHDIFNAPGVRLLPGSYVAGHGLHVFNEHPLFASLDIAPYADVAAPILGKAGLSVAEKIAPELTKAAQEQVGLLREANPVGGVARGTARILAQQRRIGATKAADLLDVAREGGATEAQLAQAAELQSKAARQSAQAEIGNVLGSTRAELRDRFSTLAARRAAKAEGLTPEAAADKLINENFSSWSHESMQGRPNEVLVPNVVKKVVDDSNKVVTSSNPLAQSLKSAMGIYRTAILPLSPRWHLYNLVGGAIATSGQTGILGFLKNLPEAWRMARDGTLPIEVSHGWVSMPAEERAAMMAEMQGRGGILSRVIGKGAAAKGQTALGWLWNANEFIDNMYRATAYLHGAEKGGEEAGIKLANKVLQDWDAQLPWERTVVKTIFPFYGWMSHILKYVATYPIDHPYRASIVANLARSEINDWKTGLPQDFQNYFYWGKDARGNEKGFNLRGANPFSDTDSIFNLGGLISQLNPVASGLLQAAGINTLSGHTDQFSQVDYDPETGRLVNRQPSTPGAFLQTAEGFVPQLTALRSIAQHTPLGNLPGLRESKQEREMKLANPAAYNQMVWSSLGIPIPRTINKRMEEAKAELSRQAVMKQAMTDALHTGNYSEVKRYPQLKEWVKLVQELDKSGALDQYRIQSPQAGVQDPTQILQRLQLAGR